VAGVGRYRSTNGLWEALLFRSIQTLHLWWEDVRRSEEVYETGLEMVHIAVVVLRWY